MKEANARLEASRTRKYRFTLRLSDEEKTAFEAGTASSGLCPTEYLRRRAILKPIVAKGYLELRAEVRRLGGEVRRFGGLVKYLTMGSENTTALTEALINVQAKQDEVLEAVTALYEKVTQAPSQELGVEEGSE